MDTTPEGSNKFSQKHPQDKRSRRDFTKHMETSMLKLKTILLPLLLFTSLTLAKPDISYKVSWDGGNRHTFTVEMTISNVSSDLLDIRMPSWRPGRYTMQNFSGNVTEFSAKSEDGKIQPFEKIDKDTWQIKTNGAKTIIATYNYYGALKDAGNSYVDPSEAFLNPVTMLTYIPGKEMLPATIELDTPEGWKIASALESADRKNVLIAKSYHELADSPILVSPDFNTLQFKASAGATIEIVIQGKRGYSEQDLLTEVRAIVNEQFRMMKTVPFKRYVFIYHFEPTRIRHGVEHKNSTSIVAGPYDYSDGRFIRSLRSLTAHEFFHVWNVERIRPESIWMPDYSKEGYTRTMWFYEGVTEYYSNLSIHRSGLIDSDRYLQKLGSAIGRVENNPGRHISSTALASWDSWVTFERRPPQSSVSFYTQGEVLGALVDLRIMQQTDGEKSLLDVMRYLYAEYPEKNRGVPEDGIQKAIEKITGENWGNFFSRYIYGREVPDYKAIFSGAGVSWTGYLPLSQPQSWIGIDLRDSNGELNITSVTSDSPADKAGITIGDQLIAINRQKVTSRTFHSLLENIPVGEAVTLSYFRQGKLQSKTLRTAKNPYRSYLLKKSSSASPKELKIRANWLND